MTANLILLLNFSATVFMTGLVWFVQVIHYPLYLKIKSGFVDYELMHTRLTSRLTAPVMLIEMITTILMWWQWPSFYVLNIVISFLLLVIWISTFLVQIPLHNKLCKAQDEMNCNRLVKSNWIRTIAWTVKSIILSIYFIELAML